MTTFDVVDKFIVSYLCLIKEEDQTEALFFLEKHREFFSTLEENVLATITEILKDLFNNEDEKVKLLPLSELERAFRLVYNIRTNEEERNRFT
jgi:hypothetical protein